jgi:hypothetical protein
MISAAKVCVAVILLVTYYVTNVCIPILAFRVLGLYFVNLDTIFVLSAFFIVFYSNIFVFYTLSSFG